MADIAVSVSTGVMTPLLEKLATLMGDEYKKLKGLRKEVSFLKRELSDMNSLLEKMDDADELDPQAKNWRKDTIEMSYNIEDCIDDFMDRVGEPGNNMGVLQKASHYLRTFIDRHLLANQFQEIKTLVIEAGERRRRYMLDQCIPSTTRVAVDPRLSALYQKSEGLVGIDGQKEEIIRWVMDESTQLKVMSIVGFGGLGKTTLANEVYREVGGKFNCKAFVSISQNPDIIKLLNSITLQVGLQPYYHACELQDLINNIRERLQSMRYFIIVDDLWDIQAWNAITCAFPQNNHYSRVMITTRIENVARASCGKYGFIHYMKQLSEQDSRKLFFDRICESEDGCHPDFVEVSWKVLKKCGGLPLAIITMASMIACQPTRCKVQWAEYIQNSLVAEFSTNPTYEDMMHIIEFSYKNLPHHLKSCFLYLGIYPEDHWITRVELVRKWVAEGFISCSRRQDVWDVAESCFNELVNRSMIQLVYDVFGIKTAYCRVHDMMLELILRKCREDNFLSVIDGTEMMSEGQDRAIRRLAVDLRRGAEDGITITTNTKHLSQVRSLNIFRGNCKIPNLTKFSCMRLLDLDVSDFKTTIDLSSINHLSQLRYLKIRGYNDKVLLPAQIRGLRLLETLDFSLLGSTAGRPLLPEIEIDDVPCLSHVSLPMFCIWRLPDGIGKMKLLVILNGFHLPSSSLESIAGLGELTALSELDLNCFDVDSRGIMPLSTLIIGALITSLGKLRNLRKLQLWSDRATVYCGDAMLGSFSPPFHKIEWLFLHLLIFSSVPRWIGQHLRCLRVLGLAVKQVHQADLNVIGTGLTSLVELHLYISHVPTERIVIGGSTGYKVLESFEFNCDGVSCLTFESGAMPDLRWLELTIDPDKWDKAPPHGLQHLPSLEGIHVVTTTGVPNTPILEGIDLEDRCQKTKEEVRDIFQEAADAVPTLPAVQVYWGLAWRPVQHGG